MMDKLKGFYVKNKIPVWVVLMVLLVTMPLYVSAGNMRIVCRIMLYIILAGGLNVISGYCGQLCFGIAGFYCVGSYVQAILMKTYNVSYWLALLPSGIVAALIGAVVALPALRMKGIFLGMITIGFSELMRLIALNWTPVTGGAMGFKGIMAPTFFGIKMGGASKYYYIFLFVVIAYMFCTNRVIKSRVGRAWMSIREDELAARSLGVDAKKYKILNFMYGSFWAGIAGAIFVAYSTYVDSTYFTLDEGFNVLGMLIIGGQGTLVGPIVGSFVAQVLTESLRFINVWRYVVYAALIILMMWVRPQGLIGASGSILAGSKAGKKKTKKAEKIVKSEGKEA
ncbi:MAG: ABC-type branched-chain amino acid transport system, permease component [Anaerocolumna sp.]|jgi:branched-chain amino acid transport system permease protein|nr:ABC-type branched-chain amino acid transport system, permease component [Anaerocolumna sp.]